MMLSVGRLCVKRDGSTTGPPIGKLTFAKSGVLPGYPKELLERFPSAKGGTPRKFGVAQPATDASPARSGNTCYSLLTLALANPNGRAKQEAQS
jgi:hypothetical protein